MSDTRDMEFPILPSIEGFYQMAQGPAELIDEVSASEEIKKDDRGFTFDNLHRRTYTSEDEANDLWPIAEPDPLSGTAPVELFPREYEISTKGLNAYLTTTITYHDEERPTNADLQAFKDGTLSYEELIQFEVP